jgi:hypothetical protein
VTSADKLQVAPPLNAQPLPPVVEAPREMSVSARNPPAANTSSKAK